MWETVSGRTTEFLRRVDWALNYNLLVIKILLAVDVIQLLVYYFALSCSPRQLGRSREIISGSRHLCKRNGARKLSGNRFKCIAAFTQLIEAYNCMAAASTGNLLDVVEADDTAFFVIPLHVNSCVAERHTLLTKRPNCVR